MAAAAAAAAAAAGGASGKPGDVSCLSRSLSMLRMGLMRPLGFARPPPGVSNSSITASDAARDSGAASSPFTPALLLLLLLLRMRVAEGTRLSCADSEELGVTARTGKGDLILSRGAGAAVAEDDEDDDDDVELAFLWSLALLGSRCSASGSLWVLLAFFVLSALSVIISRANRSSAGPSGRPCVLRLGLMLLGTAMAAGSSGAGVGVDLPFAAAAPAAVVVVGVEETGAGEFDVAGAFGAGSVVSADVRLGDDAGSLEPAAMGGGLYSPLGSVCVYVRVSD